MRLLRDNWIPAAFAVGIAIALALVIWASAKDSEAFKKHCEGDLGGRVDSSTSTTTSYGNHLGPDGKMTFGQYTSSTTTTYCLAQDGGILEVK